MSNEVRNLKAGDIVRHFKRETLSDKVLKDSPTMYLYRIISMDVQHTETGEKFVCYQALYGDGQVYVRPKEMFLSKVDREKYPNIKQEYRLEHI